jgi:hypothetical protein
MIHEIEDALRDHIYDYAACRSSPRLRAVAYFYSGGFPRKSDKSEGKIPPSDFQLL